MSQSDFDARRCRLSFRDTTIELRVEEPKAFRRFSFSLVEMAIVTGILLRALSRSRSHARAEQLAVLRHRRRDRRDLSARRGDGASRQFPTAPVCLARAGVRARRGRGRDGDERAAHRAAITSATAACRRIGTTGSAWASTRCSCAACRSSSGGSSSPASCSSSVERSFTKRTSRTRSQSSVKR